MGHEVPSLIVFFIIAFCGQVQSIDYSGDEVQVTMTDGTGCTAQKVSAGISLGVAGAWAEGTGGFPTERFALCITT